jgi:hypothetical protein
MAKQSSEFPDLQTPGGRLRWAREAWGLPSSRAAAERFGWNENTYKSHELGIRGSEGFKLKTAERYARAFGVSVEWLTTGRGSPSLKLKSDPDKKWDDLTEQEKALAIRLIGAAKALP